MRHKIKKLLNTTLACFMALSMFQVNWTAKAAVHKVSEEFPGGWMNNGLVTGEGAILRVDGKVAFCLQAEIPASKGDNEEIDPSDINLTTRTMNTLALIAWYGYRSQPSTTNYFLTQNLIWDYLGDGRNYVSSAAYPNKASMQSFFDIVMDKVNHFHDKPSFHNKTFEVTVNETLKIKDTKKVLSGLTIESVKGATVKKDPNDKNTLLVTPNINSSDTLTIRFNRGMSLAQTRTNFVVRNGNSQGVSPCLSGRDPYTSRVLVKIQKYGNLDIKKLNEDGDEVPGTKFKLSYNADMSNPIGTFTTGDNGIAHAVNLNPQKVYVQEVSVPAPYVLDPTIGSITIEPNKTVTFTRTNNFKTGNVEIKKLDKQSGKVVKRSGVTFDIFKADDTLVGTIATNSDGIATMRNLRYGNYYALEKTNPPKYFLSDERINFAITENDVTIQKSLSNDQKKGKIELEKHDPETGTRPQGDGVLDGAQYTLYAKEDILDPADDSVIHEAGKELGTATIVNNKASFENLYLGTYTVKETKAPPKGYLIDEREYTVELTDSTWNRRITSYDPVMKQAFKIAKIVVNDGTPGVKPGLEGAEFTAMLKKYVDKYGSVENAVIEANKANSEILPSEWDVMTTNKEGTAISKELPYGLYVVAETYVPEHHEKAPDFEVTIDKDDREPKPFVYVNDPNFETIIAIVKKDAETQNTIPVAGATFKVKCLTKNDQFKEGQYVGWWQYSPLPHFMDTFTTTKDGTLMLPEKLTPGTYQIEEVRAPNGYLLAETGQIFTIDSNGFHQQLGPDDETIITTVFFDDEPVKGQVKIQKEALLFKGYTSTETKYGELFTPIYERGLLPNVKFEIKAKTDIIGIDGKTWYRAGQRVAVLTTDGETITTSGHLPIGSEGNNIYSIQEIETEEGYVLDNTPHYFRFDYVDENTAIVDPTWLDEDGNEIEADEILTLDNQHQTSIIPTTKLMESSELKDKLEAYKKVVFGIFSDHVNQLEKDSLVGIVDVDENGNAKGSLTQEGTYYLRELTTDDDYLLSDEKYPFTYSYNGDKQQVIQVNNGDPIYNYLKRGTIEIYKQDADSKLPLMNVCFELATDKDFTNIIKTTWTDENGKAIFDELEANYTYYIREKYDGNHDMVDKGYVYDPSIHEVTLNDTETITVNLTNTQVKGKVQFTKTGESFRKAEIVEGEFGKEHHPIWEQGNLLGAELTIKATEDITTWDQTEHFKKGDIVAVLESDWQTTDSLLLPVGKYEAYESKTPHGYIKDETIYTFEIKPNGKADIQLNPVSINNNRAKVNLDFTKALEKQEIFSNPEAYKDVVFGLYAREDIYNYMGEVVIENGSLIGISHIDKQGHLTNHFDLPNGVYYFKELQTNDQYQLDAKEYDFEVGYPGEEVKEYTIEINEGEPINNDLKRASIEIIKTTTDSLHYTKAEQEYADSFHIMEDYMRIYNNPITKDEPNYLAGVTFEIATDENFANIIDTKKTDGNGRIVFDELELGTYYIREKATLAHYVLTDEVFKVELTKHGQVETIEVDNRLMKADINIHKVDEADRTIALQSAEFTMYADKECTEKLSEAVTNQLGNASFKDITFGTTVYIKETKAPTGYELSDKVTEVTINDEWINKESRNRVIEITNRKIPEIPNTGDHTNIILYLGLLGISFGILLTASRKRITC